MVPELDRLHILLPEPLELRCHWLIPVPQRLAVRLRGLRFWDVDPDRRHYGSHIRIHTQHINTNTIHSYTGIHIHTYTNGIFSYTQHKVTKVLQHHRTVKTGGSQMWLGSSRCYLSMSSDSSSWGLQKERYVVRKVRTKLGSGERKRQKTPSAPSPTRRDRVQPRPGDVRTD